MIHYRIHRLCRVPQALGKAWNTLGKDFAECNTRQRAHSKKINGKGLFAECYLSGTPQSICRVPKNTRQRKALDKIKTEKNPEKNSKKNLLNQVRHPPANARPCGIFRVKFTCFAAGGIQTRDLSRAHNLLYHSTPLSLVSILCFPSPHIITNWM